MSLTRDQVVDLLSVAAHYDNRKPNPDSVLAWTEAADRGRWSMASAVEAIHEHYANSTAFCMPAHITAHIRWTRAQPPQIPTQRDPLAIEGQPRPQLPSQRPKAEPEHISAVLGELADQLGWKRRERPLRDLLAVRCPHCHALPGQKCTRPSRNGRTELDDPHPARIEAADSEETPT